ncbi:MAG: hypothetical protein ACYTG0_40370 [Planctomycetota bacterium]
MRKIALLPLVALAVGCGDTATAPDDLGVAFKKGQGKGGPKAEYSFAYDTEADHTLGSNCWKMSPETTYGKTFWCVSPDPDSDPPADPTFVFQVLKDGEPVGSGEITFKRCETVRSGTKYEVGTVMDWTYCGVLLKKYRRFFGGVDYRTVPVTGGLAQVTLDDFWTAPAKELAVWGMHWEYDQGDGWRPEAEIKWLDLAHVGYVNPPDTQ